MVLGYFVEYRGYVGSIEYSSEDAIFTGGLLNINDAVVTYAGDTIEDLYQCYREAVDYYIES